MTRLLAWTTLLTLPIGAALAQPAPAMSPQSFALSCEGKPVGNFSQATGIDMPTSAAEMHLGSGGNQVRKTAGIVRVSEITLTGGTLAGESAPAPKSETGWGNVDSAANAWGSGSPDGRTASGSSSARKSCQIVLGDSAGAPLVTWQLQNTMFELLSQDRGKAQVRLKPETIAYVTAGH